MLIFTQRYISPGEPIMNKPTHTDLVDFAMMCLVIVLFAYTVALIASTAGDIL